MPKESKQRRDSAVSEVRNRLNARKKQVRELLDAEHESDEAWRREIEEVISDLVTAVDFLLQVQERQLANSIARTDQSPTQKIRKSLSSGNTLLGVEVVEAKALPSAGGDGTGETFRPAEPGSGELDGNRKPVAESVS